MADPTTALPSYTEYRKFLEYFVKEVDIDDPLPVDVGKYVIKEYELKGEIINWTSQYLTKRNCPQTLIARITRLVIDEIFDEIDNRKPRKRPELILEKNGLKSVGCMKAVIKTLINTCFGLLSNLELHQLPEPQDSVTHHVPKYGVRSVKNKRRSNEDRYSIIDDFNGLFGISDVPPTSYYALFDGHAGADAAIYCATQLHCNIINCGYSNKDKPLANVIHEAYNKTDKNFLAKHDEGNSPGTTALCAIYRPTEKKLYISWLGDSQAILVSDTNILSLVDPHKPENQSESERIEKNGGSVILIRDVPRVNGLLAVSRAIGDKAFKDYVCSDPDIGCIPLTGNENFLILACDGLWDYVSSAEASQVVYDQLTINADNLNCISHKLIEVAKQSGSKDNITVIVVFLKDPHLITPPSPTTKYIKKMAHYDKNHMLILPEDQVNKISWDNGYNNEVPNQTPQNGRATEPIVSDNLYHNDSQITKVVESSEFIFGQPPNGDSQFAKQSFGECLKFEVDDFGPETNVDATDDVHVDHSPNIDDTDFRELLTTKIKDEFDIENSQKLEAPINNASIEHPTNPFELEEEFIKHNVVDIESTPSTNENDNRLIESLHDHQGETIPEYFKEDDTCTVTLYGMTPSDFIKLTDEATNDKLSPENDEPEVSESFRDEKCDFENFDSEKAEIDTEFSSRDDSAELTSSDFMKQEETEHVSTVIKPQQVDNVVVADSGDDSEDEWNYTKHGAKSPSTIIDSGKVEIENQSVESPLVEQKASVIVESQTTTDLDDIELNHKLNSNLPENLEVEGVESASIPKSEVQISSVQGSESGVKLEFVNQGISGEQEFESEDKGKSAVRVIPEKLQFKLDDIGEVEKQELLEKEDSDEDDITKSEDLTDDMSSHLNPDAKEFIPVSPQHTSPVNPLIATNGTFANRVGADYLIDDQMLAQSPRKAIQMDNIDVPTETDFKVDIAKRPNDLGVGSHITEELISAKEFYPPSIESPLSQNYQEMNLKEAMHGDEKLDYAAEIENVLSGDAEEQILIDNLEQTDTDNEKTSLYDTILVKKEQDPMKMSFYNDGSNNEYANNPFSVDLNAVQQLPLSDEDSEGDDKENAPPTKNELPTDLFNGSECVELPVSSEQIEKTESYNNNALIDSLEAETVENKLETPIEEQLEQLILDSNLPTDQNLVLDDFEKKLDSKLELLEIQTQIEPEIKQSCLSPVAPEFTPQIDIIVKETIVDHAIQNIVASDPMELHKETLITATEHLLSDESNRRILTTEVIPTNTDSLNLLSGNIDILSGALPINELNIESKIEGSEDAPISTSHITAENLDLLGECLVSHSATEPIILPTETIDIAMKTISNADNPSEAIQKVNEVIEQCEELEENLITEVPEIEQAITEPLINEVNAHPALLEKESGPLVEETCKTTTGKKSITKESSAPVPKKTTSATSASKLTKVTTKVAPITKTTQSAKSTSSVPPRSRLTQTDKIITEKKSTSTIPPKVRSDFKATTATTTVRKAAGIIHKTLETKTTSSARTITSSTVTTKTAATARTALRATTTSTATTTTTAKVAIKESVGKSTTTKILGATKTTTLTKTKPAFTTTLTKTSTTTSRPSSASTKTLNPLADKSSKDLLNKRVSATRPTLSAASSTGVKATSPRTATKTTDTLKSPSALNATAKSPKPATTPKSLGVSGSATKKPITPTQRTSTSAAKTPIPLSGKKTPISTKGPTPIKKTKPTNIEKPTLNGDTKIEKPLIETELIDNQIADNKARDLFNQEFIENEKNLSMNLENELNGDNVPPATQQIIDVTAD